RFVLALQHKSDLPHRERPEYPIQAVLASPDPAVFDRELRQASFTLDGQPLEPASRPASPSGKWRKGWTLTRRGFVGEHPVCVRVGRPAAGAAVTPLELPLAFPLRDGPYDVSHGVDAFTLKVLIAPPAGIERWRAFLLRGSAILAP